MKIYDANYGGVGSSQLGRTQQADAIGQPGSRTAHRAGSASSDQVQISGLAAHVRSLVEGTPERSARLDRLSAEVASGRYRVDAASLSRKLVDETLKSKV